MEDTEGVRFSKEYGGSVTKQQQRDAARREFADNLLEAFHIRNNRKALREEIDQLTAGLVFVDDITENKLTYLFDTLYRAGTLKSIADQQAEEIRRVMKGSKLYISERVKHEFGDDWDNVRRAAFGAGIYFVNDKKARKLDSKYEEMAESFGGIFKKDELDEAKMISTILEAVGAGTPRTMTLEEAAFNEGGKEAVAAQLEYLDSVFRKEFELLAKKFNVESTLKTKKELQRMPAKERIAYLRQLYGLDRATENLRQQLQRTGDVPEGMTIDEYTQTLDERARQEKEDRIRFISREDFRATPAIERLGIKIDGTVADYSMTEQLLRRDRAAKSVKREVKKAEKRLAATPAEKRFAAGVTRGIYTESDIPKTMRAATVMELADYYAAEAALGEDMIRQRRRDINSVQQEAAAKYFGQVGAFKKSSMLIMNERTPTRNMLHMFGDKLGAEINSYYFEPAGRNSAEMIRFVNAQMDRVRTFEGKDGKNKELTKDERALVQQVIEGRAVAETVAGLEMKAAIRNAADNIKKGTDAGDAAKEFGLKADEADLAVKYSRWMETQEIIEKGNYDEVRIGKAAEKYSQLFDAYYTAINDFLVSHGYEPIGWIKGYAPHLQPEENHNVLITALSALGIIPM